MSRRFAWPCSQLTPELMHRLHLAREKSKPVHRPITQLVKEAIEQCYPGPVGYVERLPRNDNEPQEAA